MSWEEGPSTKHSCPCGNGHYAVVPRSDDWGRYEERWEMLCPSCKETYGLYSLDYNRKGMVSTSHSWVPQQLLRELATGALEVEQAKEMLSAYAISQYEERWSRHFSGKTKKAIWRELTQDGNEYPSLPTFYLQIRDSSLSQQLSRYFNYRQLSTVVRILQLSDTELHVRMGRVQKLERALEEKHSHAQQQRHGAI